MKIFLIKILTLLYIFQIPNLIHSNITTPSLPSLSELKILLEDYMIANSSNKENEEENFLTKTNKENEEDGCWLKAMGRGVGKPIHSCPKDQDKSGLLCYPKCQENYTGVGPVCWQNCEKNFRDDGAYCFKTPPYGRGAGYVLWKKDKCEKENPIGCEKYGLLYYPKCKPGFKNFGCCICTPTCPEGMTDIGISCQKKSYGRGVGKPLGCGDEQDYDAGLCYGKCQNGFKGIGPVCWDSCPVGYEKCGALCLKNKTCSSQMRQYFQGVIDIIIAFAAEKNAEGIIDIGKFATDFIYPTCNK